METKEKEVAAGLNGKLRPASGAIPTLKGDIISDKYLGEVKYTSKKSFLVTKRLLNKIAYEAAGEGRVPILVICFKNIYTIVPISDFEMVDNYYLEQVVCQNNFALSERIFERVANQTKKEYGIILKFKDSTWVIRRAQWIGGKRNAQR